MPITAAELVRELAKRTGEYVLAFAAGTGDTTHLVDALLIQYYPTDIASPHFNAWVYGVTTASADATPADASNRGVERRAASWDAANTRLTLYAPMPAAMTTGNYEIYQRTPRERKLAALNDAVRQLDSTWYREVVDTSLVTSQNQWGYTLPTTVPWTSIYKIEIQMNPNANFASYPYADAMSWNVEVRKSTDTLGNNTWTLQFGTIPPPGRIIRVWGLASYPDLAQEGDILGIPDSWNEALGWIYDFAEYRLWQWEANRQPSGQTERLRQAKIDALMAARQTLLDQAPSRRNVRITVPGRGDGAYHGSSSDTGWLGAFGSQH